MAGKSFNGKKALCDTCVYHQCKQVCAYKNYEICNGLCIKQKKSITCYSLKSDNCKFYKN